ncbi:MAG: protein kinase [Gemmataceae bacterium]
MSDQPQMTIEFESGAVSATPRSSAQSKAQVELVAGSKPRFSSESTSLLRQRLLAANVVVAVGLTLALVTSFLPGRPTAPYLGVRIGVLVGVYAAIGLLWSRVTLSAAALRIMDICFVVMLALLLTLMFTGKILADARADPPDAIAANVHVVFVYGISSIFLLLYGMLMPHTWKQAALILFPLACYPYLLQYGLAWYSEGVASMYKKNTFFLPLPMPFLAAFAAVYVSHTIHQMRREAFKARQLGQYRLKEKLGTGGMGEVYKAEHQLLKRPCAIKLIKPGKDTDANALARFEREVQATAQLSHWNVVDIYDYGRTPDTTFYYVMELLPGMSLEELTQHEPRLPPARIVHFLCQACNGLLEAHASGLIHRDLKPANLFVAKRGGFHDVIKILDFGLVKGGDDGDGVTNLTQEGMISGTPLFMSPEQAMAEELDVRSDIYSLGCVAYQLLTGEPPFVRKSTVLVLMAHVGERPMAPSQLHPSVPADLEKVILRCLEKKPDDRFSCVSELEQALASCKCASGWTEDDAAFWWKNVHTRKSGGSTADTMVIKNNSQ